MAKNFKKKVIYKSIRSYDSDCNSEAIAYAAVERCSWDTYCGKTNYTLCYLDILCPNEEVKKCYQQINNNEKFCVKDKMIGCIKNFSYRKKTFDTGYTYTEIVERYNNTYLRFVLSFDEEIEQTDEELLEKIENSYENVAKAIIDAYNTYFKKADINKKAILFNQWLLYQKASVKTTHNDEEQAVKDMAKVLTLEEEYNKFLNEAKTISHILKKMLLDEDKKD